ncbi:hypothetical protein [Kitasatospora sp. NPDC097643]|uniref:uridine kinase family protein n=1 Tax=Kitasatospora sp. NPDC097643 TaxID=3157230 RepID=UPI00332D8159
MLLTLTGGSGAGKTALARALAASPARPGPVGVLHADDYYFPTPGRGGVWAPDESGVPRLDVGDPASVDFDRLTADTEAALAASAAVIVDGLFARLITPRSRGPRLDVFVDLPADLRLARKIDRKCVRGDFPVAVLLHNYVQHRRAAHERHIEPLRPRCELVVDGGQPPEALAERIWSLALAG